MAEEKRPAEQISTMSVIADFCNKFKPCEESEADEVFTIGRLRDEFAAWVQFGSDNDDPLVGYIKTLEANGFCIRKTYGSGPAILVKYKENDEQKL